MAIPWGRGQIIMGTEKRYCSICAWRENCQKRFSVSTDTQGFVHCPDYTRDISIKDSDIDKVEKRYCDCH